MSRYIMIRRLRTPVVVLLLGALALLHQMGVLSIWKSWPLLLILWGVILLAERAALAIEGGYPPYPGAPDPRTATGIPPYPGQPAAYVPPQQWDSGDKPEEGQL
ncbi:MAG: DUF5668 domain-containing protein [Terracidiphilus sp.]|jgi:hypothetical protein